MNDDRTSGDQNADDLSSVLADYLDRLNSGEKLDPIEVVADHPSRGSI